MIWREKPTKAGACACTQDTPIDASSLAPTDRATLNGLVFFPVVNQGISVGIKSAATKAATSVACRALPNSAVAASRTVWVPASRMEGLV